VKGTLFTFGNVHELEKAARALHERGVTRMEAFLPFAWEPLDGHFPKERRDARLSEANLPGCVTLTAAAAAALTVFGTMTLAQTWSNPFDAGGRPLFSWPTYVPITFVLTVLAAAGSLFLSYFWEMRLPEPYHPIFDAPDFRLDKDQFHLFLDEREPRFREAHALLAASALRHAEVSA
jgi:hypothetical protein